MEKWITPVNSLLAILIITALAMISADLVTRRIARIAPASSGPTAKTSQQAPVAKLNEDITSFAPILEQGLFGTATRGKLSTITIAAANQKPGAPPLNQGDMLLLGSALGSFRETFALIQKTGTREERVFRLGDRVFDAGQLVSVQKEYAEVLISGKRIKILSPTAPGAGPAGPGANPVPQQGGLATQIGSGSYVIDQRALNAALDNIGQAMTDARMLPSTKDGKVEGFRVSEVKPTGIFATIGIKNGDVLLRINDFPIDSPEKAIQSFASLKGQSRIKLDMIRDGQPSSFNYDIR
ncbi:PDZ domain-containing protein [Geobacter pelophilus]|uniref:PDZ domain-containing protein n=1 Tax=Geoanaerobacter pelophilus TaxID=60036 RepID=A0AAW4L886_9BACT|nr:type II secretion system protein GspC [Geoanaerobacter pelophilus]MBT0664027.1 PDZ domain-containing protein [Geoanaerobacter pelophilus]